MRDASLFAEGVDHRVQHVGERYQEDDEHDHEVQQVPEHLLYRDGEIAQGWYQLDEVQYRPRHHQADDNLRLLDHERELIDRE